LEDILEAIERIERYAARGRAAFEADDLIQVWVLYHLQILGEAARKLSDALRQGHPEVPWAQIIAMRNILVHDYFGLDVVEVWAAVERDIPDLKRKIESILGLGR
jgi:uncharacterized protein with HEPN domain